MAAALVAFERHPRASGRFLDNVRNVLGLWRTDVETAIAAFQYRNFRYRHKFRVIVAACDHQHRHARRRAQAQQQLREAAAFAVSDGLRGHQRLGMIHDQNQVRERYLGQRA